MHAPGHRWTTLILIFTVALAVGCRGSRPFGRVVQVTKEVDPALPEIEPPRQRLATTKPREEFASESMGAERPEGSPHVTRPSSSMTASSSARSTQPAATPGSQMSMSDRSPNARTATRRSIASNPAAKEGQQNIASRTASSRRADDAMAIDDSIEIDVAAHVAAFRNASPEVQQQAERQAIAASSRLANQSKQPKAMDAQLENSTTGQLPELPGAKDAGPAVSATSVASDRTGPAADRTGPAADRTGPAATVASITDIVISDDENTAGPGDSLASDGRVTDLVTTELESTAVQTISDSDLDDESAVKPASASRSENDSQSIARAAIDASRPTSADQTAIADQTASAEPAENASQQALPTETSQLTDKTLYATLLKRLSTPQADESEAERSSRLIRLRHLMVLSGNPDEAVESIEGMSAAEQEYLRHQLLGLWTMIDPQGHPVPSRRFTTALPQIREAAKFAAAATDSLEVRSLAFCTEIESYGQIKTFSGNRFEAGQQVILYCEIENFTVNKNDEGFETHLQGSYDIYDSSNQKVVSQLLPADQQVSANYLRDYFIAYQMHLPQQLSNGTYRLQLTMEDVSGKKYGQASIPFEIAK